jgi:hypothetical protein
VSSGDLPAELTLSRAFMFKGWGLIGKVAEVGDISSVWIFSIANCMLSAADSYWVVLTVTIEGFIELKGCR